MRTRLMPAMLLAWFFMVPAFAQETRSAMFGRVTDPQNSVIPGAMVVVTNPDTNTAMTLFTNETGYYEANLLIAGNYRVSVEKPGFRKVVRSGIVLPISARVEINFVLQVGEVSETVSVTAESPLVDTNSAASAGRVMDTREVLD